MGGAATHRNRNKKSHDSEFILYIVKSESRHHIQLYMHEYSTHTVLYTCIVCMCVPVLVGQAELMRSNSFRSSLSFLSRTEDDLLMKLGA